MTGALDHDLVLFLLLVHVEHSLDVDGEFRDSRRFLRHVQVCPHQLVLGHLRAEQVSRVHKQGVPVPAICRLVDRLATVKRLQAQDFVSVRERV